MTVWIIYKKILERFPYIKREKKILILFHIIKYVVSLYRPNKNIKCHLIYVLFL